MKETGAKKVISTEKLMQGDEKNFKLLFQEFYPSLCLFADKYLKNGDTAADIVQDAFIKYWNRNSDFDELPKIKSFLYIVVRHSCLNLIRDSKTYEQVDETTVDSELFFRDNFMEEETSRIFHQAVDSLPDQIKKVIYHSLDGLKNSEIAEKMQLSEGTIHAYKKEAYKKLRLLLKDHYYLVYIATILLNN